ncbi:MAG: STAS domain-containing protein [Solirubrobacterales bacterium]|nr:STAS domain-containing protein [Solirubrobacterales bacterium]
MTNPEETLAATGDPSPQEPGTLSHGLGALSQEPDALSQEPGALLREPARLSVVIHDLPECTLVAVGGELDLLTAPQLAAELEPILTADHRHIAIDLTETSFMDSAGIHALVNIGNRARRHFAVICPAGTVRRTIELVGLAEPLCVVDSLDEYKRRRAGS